MFDATVLAKNIRTERKKVGLTQSQLAQKLYVTDRAVSKWEMALSVPELDKLCNIADIFSTTLDKLVGHNGSVSNQKAYIGIDGGATKSEFVLFTHDGTVMQRFCSCGCNPNVYGIDKACEVLKNGIDILMDMKYKVEGIFLRNSRCQKRDKSSEIQ